jgi:DNA-binding transcriptional ArsR family regulator
VIKAHLIPHVAKRFKALGEPARLELVAVLQAGEQSVSELVELTGRGQPNVSQHLGALVNAGLVASRREGARVYYRIEDPMVLEICGTICRSVERAAMVPVPGERVAAPARKRPAIRPGAARRTKRTGEGNENEREGRRA